METLSHTPELQVDKSLLQRGQSLYLLEVNGLTAF